MITKIIDLYEYFKIEKPNGARGKLKVYVPDRFEEYGLNRLRPASLIIPGGSYRFTSEREAEPVALKFLTQGYCAFVLYYSCYPLSYPVAFKESAMAMVYIREHSQEYGIIEDKIVSIGFSAGGHLCGCLATLCEERVLDFLGNKKPLAKPNACALMYPVITSSKKSHVDSINNISGKDETLKEFLSLEKRVTRNSVPAYIFATNMDTAVPSRNALLMALAYEENEVPFTLHILEKGNHGLSVNDLTSDTPNALKERFVSTPINYNDWISQLFIWLNERGFTVVIPN